MADFSWSVPKGDGRTTALTVKVNGVAIDLNGYTITVKATLQLNPATTFTRTLTVVSPTTAAGPDILPGDTVTPGYYQVSLSAFKVGSPGPFTAVGSLEVVDHP
jgi:hypothetical protein